MDILFLDTSALVKRYVGETGSTWIANLCDVTANNLIYIAELTPVEITAAVTRRAKGCSLSVSNALNALNEFEDDLANEYHVLEINSALLKVARRFARLHGLRGYDAVQLAVAVNFSQRQIISGLSVVIFVSSDDELLVAAKAEGLMTENPNNYS